MKERLDILLVNRNLAASREKAKAIIMSGNVFVDGQREDKAGTTFPEEVNIEIKGHTLPYVSRVNALPVNEFANMDLRLSIVKLPFDTKIAPIRRAIGNRMKMKRLAQMATRNNVRPGSFLFF